jgi:DNA-binding MarR family transcriptional regulator
MMSLIQFALTNSILYRNTIDVNGAMTRSKQLMKRQYETLAAFRYALRKFIHFSEEAAHTAGLAPQQHQALLAIKGFPGRETVSVGELAERLQLRHHSAVGLVDRLVAGRLVSRATSADDRRQVVVQLTCRGENVLAKLSSAHSKQLKRIGPELNLLLKQLGCADDAKTSSLPVVLTIGHSSRPLTEFIGLLQAHAVSRVVDVRTIPRSRHNPQFNKASLPRALKKAGLGYVHLPGLGGLRHAKPNSINMGWRNTSFRGYADYMQTPEFAQSLEELIQLAKQGQIAIMCAEAVPWRCHRSLIADALLVRGIRTEDIMSPTRRQVHALTLFAKVRGAKITYPGGVSRSNPKQPDSH